MKLRVVSVLFYCLFFMNCKKDKHSITAPIITVSEEYHGVKITDPYQYMENTRDSTVINWFKAQGKYAQKLIEAIPGRKSLLERIKDLENSTLFAVFEWRITNDDQYFYLKKMPKDSVAKLYYRKGFDGEEIELFNPRNYKPDSGEEYLINYIKPDWNGSKIVIGLTKNDEEFSDLLVLDVNSGQELFDLEGHSMPTHLGGVDWLPDNSGFVYTYVPDTDTESDNYLLNTKSVVYRFGDTSKLQDVLSAKNNPDIDINEEEFPFVYYTNPKNKYAIGVIAGGGKYRDLYYTNVTDFSNKKKINWKPLLKEEDMTRKYYLEENDLYYLSAKHSPHLRICKLSIDDPNVENTEVVVEEDPDAIITDYALTEEGLFYVKTKNGVEAKLYQMKEGKEKEISLPKPSGHIDIDSKGGEYSDLWVEIEGWINNKERYRYDASNNTFIEENLSPVVTYPELNDVVVEEIEIPSHDGEMVPLSIIYKKGIQKNGKNRVLLNGYGAFRWSNSPYLYPYLLHWVSEGGIYAVAHVRGGGEKGDAWHKAGYKTTKSNTWKDFIACTEYFINEGYTTTEQIAAWGASGGGINIARAITERPDLYAVAVIKAGVINTLRSEFAPNGANLARELGTVKDSAEFKALLEMDAYHHVNDGIKYPAIYLTAGMNDARVPAWHSGKFAARLQAATVSNKPIFFSVDFEAGHGFDVDKNKENKELVNILSFLFWQTGHPGYQTK